MTDTYFPLSITDLSVTDALTLLDLVIDAVGPDYLYGADNSLVPGWDHENDQPAFEIATLAEEGPDCRYIHFFDDEGKHKIPGCIIGFGLAILDPDGWTEYSGVEENNMADEIFIFDADVASIMRTAQRGSDAGHVWGSARQGAYDQARHLGHKVSA